MWAVVEIMGRRTRAGMCSDAQLGGATMLCIAHPVRVDADGDPVRELYASQAIFAVRPCTRDEAAAVADWAWPEPRNTPALPASIEDHLDDDDTFNTDVDDEQDLWR